MNDDSYEYAVLGLHEEDISVEGFGLVHPFNSYQQVIESYREGCEGDKDVFDSLVEDKIRDRAIMAVENADIEEGSEKDLLERAERYVREEAGVQALQGRLDEAHETIERYYAGLEELFIEAYEYTGAIDEAIETVNEVNKRFVDEDTPVTDTLALARLQDQYDLSLELFEEHEAAVEDLMSLMEDVIAVLPSRLECKRAGPELA